MTTASPTMHNPSVIEIYPIYLLIIFLALAYLLLVRYLRYQRFHKICSPFGHGKRPLSSMTTSEAYDILTQLQALEFPAAFNKARQIALLKAGGIPTMSKLFAVTGQNNRRNAGKRAVDTEILLREAQTQPRDSDRYMDAVARMNYLHARYRKAGKILDEDLLHTLGDGAAEILRVVDTQEWRTLSDVEKCAVGIFHRNLGEDMGIPFKPLKETGAEWENGIQFLNDLVEWTREYEEKVAKPTATNDMYVRVYVDSATEKLGKGVTLILRKVLGYELDDTMRESLCIEAPGLFLKSLLDTYINTRKFTLRHLTLPRSTSRAVKAVSDSPNSISGLYNFSHAGFQPWYIEPSLKSTWSPSALLVRAVGGKKPGSKGERYHPQGYDLKTIGPQPQEGKGFEEMRATVEFLKSRGMTECPFSGAAGRKREIYAKKDEV